MLPEFQAKHSGMGIFMSRRFVKLSLKSASILCCALAVADADLLGTELLAGVVATTPRTDGTSEKVTKWVGYRGAKRYVNCSI
jgi:hypothetical protein